MKDQSFVQMTDRTRLDRLQGEILAFVSDFDQSGYSNMEIARELIAAAFKRSNREKLLIRDNFHQHVRDTCIRYLDGAAAITHEYADRTYRKGN